MRATSGLTLGIVAYELMLARRGALLVSNEVWAAADTRHGRAVVTGTCAGLVAHLRWRTNWPTSLRIGLGAAGVDLLFPHDRRRVGPR